MPLPIVQDQPSEESYQGLLDRLPTTTGDQITTTFKSEFKNAVTSRVVDHFAMQALEKDPTAQTLSVDELKQKYDGLGINWDGPKKSSVADFIAERRRDEIYNQSKIDAGPQGYLSKGLRFGAGVVAHMVDPTEAALTMTTAGLGRMALAARYGAGALEGAGLLGRLGIGAVEGTAAQVGLEPVVQLSDKEFQRDFSAAEVLQRVAFGAMMGSAFEGAAYGLKSAARKMFKTGGAEVTHDIAVAQLANERPVNVDPIVDDFAHEQTGAMNGKVDYSGRTKPYEFVPFDAQKPEGKKIYIGGQSAAEDFFIADPATHGPNGFTDHIGMANNDGATKWNPQLGERTGNVYELALSKDVKLASAEAPLSLGEKKLVIDALRERGQESGPVGEAMARIVGGIEKGKISFDNVSELLRTAESLGVASESVRDALLPAFEKAGLDGLHFVEDGANRFQFSEERLKQPGLFSDVKPYGSDAELVPGVSGETSAEGIQKSMDPLADKPYNNLEMAEMDKAATEMVPEDETGVEQMATQQSSKALAEIEAMNEAGQLKPEDAKELENFKEFDSIVGNMGKAMKAAFNCVMGNG